MTWFRKNLAWLSLMSLALLISVIAFVSPACSLFNWFNTDDGYYYFTVARNIALGNGSTFDGINLTNGYHPLWMLVCTAVFFVFGGAGVTLPLRVIALLGGMLNAVSAVLLYRILSRALQKPLAWAAAAVWASLPAIQLVTTAQGLESGLAVCLLFLLVERAQAWVGLKTSPTTRQLLLIGFLAALAILARLDNSFYVLALCGFLVLKVRFRRGRFLYDWLSLSFTAYFAWAVVLLLGRSEVLDHSVFPLLFLSLSIRPLILWLGGRYRQRLDTIKALWREILRTTGWVLLSSLAMIVVLYTINSLHVSIRFAKLLIFIEGTCATLLLLLNHLLPYLHPQQTPAGQPAPDPEGRISFQKTSLVSHLRQGVLVAAPPALILSAYLLYNRLHFGSWMPVSGMMKHYWSTLFNSVYGRPRFFYDVFAWGGRTNPWEALTDPLRAWAGGLAAVFRVSGLSREFYFCMLLMLVLIVIFLLLRFGRIAALSKLNTLFLPALFIGSLARAAYYAGSGYVAARAWYWVLDTALLLILAALLLEVLAARLANRTWGRRLLLEASGLVFLGLLAGSLRFGLRFTPLAISEDQKSACFQPVRDLEAATEPGALIGMTGSGCKGFFVQGRTIVNLDGLINSRAYYDSVVNGTAAEFLTDMGLDYVYGMPEILERSGPYDALFTGHLQGLGVISNSEGLTLYRFLP